MTDKTDFQSIRISVITAAYNSEATLSDTLKSVLNQGYGNVEHIIIDGASNDGTIGIIKKFLPEYAEAGKTLRWISEKDNGIYDAMNKGIAMATGDIVGLLNSDDFYTSDNILEAIAAAFDNNTGNSEKTFDAVYGDVHYVNPGNLGKCVRYYSSRGFKRWKMRMGFMPAHPSFYCRREIYRKYGMFDTSFRIAADFEQLLRLIFIHGIKTRYMPMDFVTMRTGGASSSGFVSHRRIFADHRAAYRKNGVYSNFLFEALRYIYRIVDICRANYS